MKLYVSTVSVLPNVDDEPSDQSVNYHPRFGSHDMKDQNKTIVTDYRLTELGADDIDLGYGFPEGGAPFAEDYNTTIFFDEDTGANHVPPPLAVGPRWGDLPRPGFRGGASANRSGK